MKQLKNIGNIATITLAALTGACDKWESQVRPEHPEGTEDITLCFVDRVATRNEPLETLYIGDHKGDLGAMSIQRYEQTRNGETGIRITYDGNDAGLENCTLGELRRAYEMQMQPKGER